MKKKENLVSVYARVSQLVFVIITPLLLFLGGGYYVTRKYDLPEWVMVICVALALIFMIGGAVSYLYQLIKFYGKTSERAPKSFSSTRDNDYYDDYKKH